MATGLGGHNVVILVDGTACGGERGVSISRRATTIDITAKADYPNRKKAAGWNDSSLTLDSVYVAGDAAYAAILAAYEGYTAVILSEQESAVVLYTATAYITEITKNAPQDGESTFTMSFEISGGWAAA